MRWAGPGPSRLTFRKLRVASRRGHERLRGPGVPAETVQERARVGGTLACVRRRVSRLSGVWIHPSQRPARNSEGTGIAAAVYRAGHCVRPWRSDRRRLGLSTCSQTLRPDPGPTAVLRPVVKAAIVHGRCRDNGLEIGGSPGFSRSRTEKREGGCPEPRDGVPLRFLGRVTGTSPSLPRPGLAFATRQALSHSVASD